MYAALKYNNTSAVKVYKLMADDEHFPKQEDATSCGIYVCMLLKFIVMCPSYIPVRVNVLHQRHEVHNELEKRCLNVWECFKTNRFLV